jgi:hypothetical protein
MLAYPVRPSNRKSGRDLADFEGERTRQEERDDEPGQFCEASQEVFSRAAMSRHL